MISRRRSKLFPSRKWHGATMAVGVLLRLFLFLVLVPALARAADRPEMPKQLTLSQALAIALSGNSNIQMAQARLEQASGRYAQSRSTLLPQVDANVHQSYLTINLLGLGIDIPTVPQGRIGPFGSMDARLTLTQDLLNIANMQAWKSSRSRENSSRLLVNNAREVVVLDVVAAYLQALRAKGSRDALTEQTKLANDLYRLTEDQVKQGVSSTLESNRALQQVNSLEQQSQEAEQSYIAAKLALANVMQANITADFEVVDEAAYGAETTLDRESALSAALASRPDYLSALANVRAAKLQVQSIKAYRLPTVSTSFSDGQSGDSPSNNVNTYRLTASINVPIFTSGRIRGQIEESEGVLHEAQAEVDRLRSEIEAELLTAASGVEWALKEVTTSTANVKLSRQELDLARERFTQGVADNTEVVNAQDRISRADDAHVRAQYTLGLARANLARATGAAEKNYRK